MTGHELIAELKKMSHEQLNMEVVMHNEYFLDMFDSVRMINADNSCGYLYESEDSSCQRYIYLERT
jgi:hypothetical protein